MTTGASGVAGAVRDVGGSTFGLVDAIDAGVVPGPRAFPSSAPGSQGAREELLTARASASATSRGGGKA